ncbi:MULTISPECIES: 2-phosphosulfolactate phosphatase [unclassified Rathayibacter]|uniref:2-phosphosulfolactate phosphatase n=1 Tax=unclassified Rathayibacter TaxID=2609250 RepID=UPI00188C62E4|nr:MULTISPECIES: 2-phosphosulfolactate phosphatase [unclassified Rathayibacter]MBF4461562.1 2-phosphosulfolactate phosphatase [Rathayibacter sp. VKM Ac-2879]MBF4502973.1 2-phosphosulfolactate phosphatase [Rathayibacter sp. VKM Ac-2878]
MNAAFDQSSYQIRFEWGARGLRALAPAPVTVVVDALPGSLELDLSEVEGRVVRAGLADRTAVARWILARQHENGGRTSVNIVAVGDVDDAGEARFALEDQLAAGALVDALIGLGIDHVSPDAAVASASFEGLRRACVHVLSASASGRLLKQQGRAEEALAAARLDTVDEVTVLR